MGICCNNSDLNKKKLNQNSFHIEFTDNNNNESYLEDHFYNKNNYFFNESLFTYTGRESLTEVEKELLSISLIFEINKVRSNPKKYINQIEKYRNKIVTNQKNNSIVKVSHSNAIVLKNGKESFENCINFLNNCKPVNLLKNEPLLQIPFPEKDINQSSDNEYIKLILRKKINELKEINDNIQLKKFHYDINGECAEASCVMQLVDDSQNDLIRRKNILSDDINIINVNCTLLSKGIIIFYIAFGSQ